MTDHESDKRISNMTTQSKRPIYSAEGLKGLKEELDAYLLGVESPKILEAGCGSGSNITIPSNAHVAGIDISAEELDKNMVVKEKIVGDLETYKLSENTFDLVVCWDVLEHLKRPELAMTSMASAVKPGGMLLLAFPNVHSLKAVVAKYTPLWFHTAVNRFIYGDRSGEPGYINFPTVLDPSISPNLIGDFAENHGFEIQVAVIGQSGVQKRFFRKIWVGESGAVLADKIVQMVSLGRLSVIESDCAFLLRKAGGGEAKLS